MRIATAALLLSVVLTACEAVPRPVEPDRVDFAARLVERADAARHTATADGGGASEPSPLPDASLEMPAARGRADAWDGVLDVPSESLGTVAADPERLSTLLSEPVSADTLAALAVLRDPRIDAAWARYEAARTGYAQSADLTDLLRRYRSFLRGVETGVGPGRSRMVRMGGAPYPDVETLSAELADRMARMAFEDVRQAVRDVVAESWRVHADAARLARRRAILVEQVGLEEGLVDATEARLESGRASQAAYLALTSRLDELRADLEDLDDRRDQVLAGWNRLLSRPADAPADLDVAFGATDPAPLDDDAWADRALASRPEVRRAELSVERAELAVRMAATMSRPRRDARPTDAPPGAVPPRADFGVRDAQVAEMRAVAEAARRQATGVRDATAEATRSALAELRTAHRRVAVLRDDVVPRAADALESVHAAYAADRQSYLDLLEAERRVLRARLDLATARERVVDARARVLLATGLSPDFPEEPR